MPKQSLHVLRWSADKQIYQLFTDGHVQLSPPAWWTIAFDQSLTSARLLAFHATLWQIWRSLRIDGCLAGTRLSMV
jgi:hypothetical protein